MSDINFLPEEYKKKEEHEKKRHPVGSLPISMRKPEERPEPKQEKKSWIKSVLSGVFGGEKKPKKSKEKKEPEAKEPKVQKPVESTPTIVSKKEPVFTKPSLSAKKPEKKDENEAPKQEKSKTPADEKKDNMSEITLMAKLFGRTKDNKTAGPRVLEERLVRPPKKNQHTEPQKKDARSSQKSVIKKEEKAPAADKLAKKPEIHKTEEEPKEGGIEVNLLPESKVIQSSVKKKVLSLISIVLAMFFIAISLWGIIVSRISAVKGVNALMAEDIQDTNTSIGKLKEKININKQQIVRVEMLSTALTKRNYWSRFFERIESITLSDAYISKMSINDRALKVSIIAPDWKRAAQQLMIWQTKSSWWNEFRVSKVDKRIKESIAEDNEEDYQGEEVSNETVVGYDLNIILNPEVWTEFGVKSTEIIETDE